MRHVPGIAAYRGKFRVAEAERLLWRAGFGPRRGEAEKLAPLGLEPVEHLVEGAHDRDHLGPALLGQPMPGPHHGARARRAKLPLPSQS